MDGDMAMQLLGLQMNSGAGSATPKLEAGDRAGDSNKRKAPEVSPDETDEVEDILAQAKKAKNETSLY